MQKLIIILSFIFFAQFLFAQKTDINNKEFKYDFKNLELNKFSFKFRSIIEIVNSGVYLDRLRSNYKGVMHSESVKDFEIGLIRDSLTTEKIIIIPFLYRHQIDLYNNKLIEGDFSQITTILNSNLIDYLKNELNFKHVEENFDVMYIEKVHLKKRALFFWTSGYVNDELIGTENKDIFSSNNKSDVITVVPIYTFFKNFLNIEMRFYKYQDLMFKTNIQIKSDIDLLDSSKNKSVGEKHLVNEIIESLFHHIRKE